MANATKVRILLLSHNDFENVKKDVVSKLQPKLDKLFRTKGIDFDLLDISGLNSLQSCLPQRKCHEIPAAQRHCLQIKVIFIGDLSGPHVLPRHIHAREFTHILSSAKSLSDQPSVMLKLMKSLKPSTTESSAELFLRFQKGHDFLMEYYVKDSNSVPAAYVLTMPKHPADNADEDIHMLRQIQTVMQLSALHSSEIDDTRRRAYFTSELADSAIKLADSHSTIVMGKQSKRVSDSAKELLEELSRVVSGEMIYVVGSKHERDLENEVQNYLHHIENRVMILSEQLLKTTSREHCGDDFVNKTQKQLVIQQEICQNKLNGVQNDDSALDKIKHSFLKDKQTVILSGSPGSGTSTLLVKVTRDFPAWFGTQAAVISVFFNTSAFTSTVAGIASFLRQQLCNGKQLTYANDLDDLPTIVKHVRSEMNAIKRPTLLALDSTSSQIFPEFIEQFGWIQKITNKNVKILMTSTRKKIEAKLTNEMFSSEVFRMESFNRAAAIDLLTSLNSESHRTVTATQRDKLFMAFEKHPNPLYLKLLALLSKNWASWTKIDDIQIPTTLEGVFNKFCENLEIQFGFAFTCTVLCYIAISRFGLSLGELCGVVVTHGEIVKEIPAMYNKCGTSGVLLLLIELIKTLDYLLHTAVIDNGTLYSFSHETFRIFARKRYFKTLQSKSRHKEHNMHQHLVVAFMSSCVSDATSNDARNNRFMIKHQFCTLRALHELPYHLMAANDAKSYSAILCNADWVIAKMKLSGKMELAYDLDRWKKSSDLGLTFIKETVLRTTSGKSDWMALTMLEALIDVSGDFPQTVGSLVRGLQNVIYHHDPPQLFPVLTTKPPFSSPAAFLVFDNNRNVLLCADDDGHIAMTRLDETQRSWTKIERKNTGSKINKMVLCEERNLLVVVSDSIQVIHVDSGQDVLYAMPKSTSIDSPIDSAGPGKVVKSKYVDCVVSHDGKYLAAVENFPGFYAVLHVWNMMDGETVTYKYNPFSTPDPRENKKLRVLTKRFLVFSMFTKSQVDAQGHYKIYMVRFDKVKERNRVVKSAVIKDDDSLYFTERGDKLAVFSADFETKLNIKIYDVSSGELLAGTKTGLRYSRNIDVEITDDCVIILCDHVTRLYNWKRDGDLEEVNKDDILQNGRNLQLKINILLHSYSLSKDDEVCHASTVNCNLIFVSCVDSSVVVRLPNVSMQKRLGIDSPSLKSVMKNIFGIVANFSSIDTNKQKLANIPVIKPNQIADLMVNSSLQSFPVPHGMQRSCAPRSISESESGSSSVSSTSSAQSTIKWRLGNNQISDRDTKAPSAVKTEIINTVSDLLSEISESEGSSDSESETEMSGEYIINENETIEEENLEKSHNLFKVTDYNDAQHMEIFPNLHVTQSMSQKDLRIPKLDASLIQSAEAESSENSQNKTDYAESETESEDSSTDSDVSYETNDISALDNGIEVSAKPVQNKEAVVSTRDDREKGENGEISENVVKNRHIIESTAAHANPEETVTKLVGNPEFMKNENEQILYVEEEYDVSTIHKNVEGVEEEICKKNEIIREDIQNNGIHCNGGSFRSYKCVTETDKDTLLDSENVLSRSEKAEGGRTFVTDNNDEGEKRENMERENISESSLVMSNVNDVENISPRTNTNCGEKNFFKVDSKEVNLTTEEKLSSAELPPMFMLNDQHNLSSVNIVIEGPSDDQGSDVNGTGSDTDKTVESNPIRML